MKQTSIITRRLTAAQETARHLKAYQQDTTVSWQGVNAVLFKLYTERNPNLGNLVSRYFAGATLYPATGIWQGAIELSTVIEILGTLADLQNIVFLAGDIRQANDQHTVIVTWEPISRLDVTA